MKRILFTGISVVILTMLTSFRPRLRPKIDSVNNLVVFYVENSKGGESSALTVEAMEKLESEVKKNNATPGNKFLLFWSNDAKFDYSRKAENCSRILNELFEKNSRTPNVWLDKHQMSNLIFDKEFQLKGTITVNYFVTENYLVDYITKDEPSILMGMFPRELAYVSGVEETKVTVNIYYSNAKNKLSLNLMKSVNNFNDQSKVTYNYILVK